MYIKGNIKKEKINKILIERSIDPPKNPITDKIITKKIGKAMTAITNVSATTESKSRFFFLSISSSARNFSEIFVRYSCRLNSAYHPL